MEKNQILQLVTQHKDSFVQYIKAKHPKFYSTIHANFNGASFSEKLYRWYHQPTTVDNCQCCGKPTKFLTFRNGFRHFCSSKCANIVNRKKLSNTLKLSPLPKNPKYWEEKECLGCNVKYWSLISRQQQYCSGKCSSKSTAHDIGRLNKIHTSKLNRYGNGCFVNPTKAKETCLIKYGKENPGQVVKFKHKARLTFLKSYLHKLNTSNRLKGLITPLFTEEDFITTSRIHRYHFRCNKCNSIFQDNIDDGRIPRCLTCFPILTGTSKGEQEVVCFLQTIIPNNIIVNDRTLLPTKELDIYIPDKKIAIEYNGLFWHSEIGGRKKYNYHLHKTQACETKNTRLIHIFEDEWLYKQDIIKSMLKYILNVGGFERIYARKCNIQEITPSEMDIFMEDNHLQGNVKSPINIGLFYNKTLVSAMSFCKPRLSLGQRKIRVGYELLRFATKQNTIVVGGFSKLFNSFVRTHAPRFIVSYADRRWNSGNVYLSVGFKKTGETAPNYWYIKRGETTRYHRFKFRKSELSKKLKSFDPTLSEWENMQLNGYDRIWDCGNFKFEWSLH